MQRTGTSITILKYNCLNYDENFFYGKSIMFQFSFTN